MKRCIVAFLLLACTLARAQEWQTATPESQGMDSAALARLVEYGANAKMDSLVVVRNGRIVTEAYYAPYRQEMLHRINSATKAIVGALVGIAISRGELPGTDSALVDHFPAAGAADPRWKAIKLQHLLDMTSGMEWNEPLSDAVPTSLLEMQQSPDWERYILGHGMAQAPGMAFNYNSGGTHLLSLALARSTGMSAEAYAGRHLFGPLGISTTRWRKDPQGVPTGHAGLYLHTRDMARFGVLYLQRGEWGGKQVVPRAWAERVFAPTVEMPFPGYRYADLWWSIPGRRAYFAAGFNRQVIMVLPKLGVVAAVTGRMHYPFENLIAHLERSVKSASASPPDDAALAGLNDRIRTAASEKSLAPSQGAPALQTRSVWQIEDNRFGIRELTLDFSTPRPAYRVKLRSREFAGAIGMDGRFGEGIDAGTPIMTTARWVDANTLAIEHRWPEEADVLSYSISFNGDELEISHTDRFGARGMTRGRKAPD